MDTFVIGAWESAVEHANQVALESAIKCYEEEMKNGLATPTAPVVWESKDLLSLHDRAQKAATTLYVSQRIHRDDDKEEKKGSDPLLSALSKKFELIQVQNLEASRKQCRAISTELLAAIQTKLTQKVYLSANGYEQFTIDRIEMIEAILTRGLGPARDQEAKDANDRLTAQGDSLLAANKALSEEEKKRLSAEAKATAAELEARQKEQSLKDAADKYASDLKAVKDKQDEDLKALEERNQKQHDQELKAQKVCCIISPLLMSFKHINIMCIPLLIGCC
jgi:hypothetical protein